MNNVSGTAASDKALSGEWYHPQLSDVRKHLPFHLPQNISLVKSHCDIFLKIRDLTATLGGTIKYIVVISEPPQSLFASMQCLIMSALSSSHVSGGLYYTKLSLLLN